MADIDDIDPHDPRFQLVDFELEDGDDDADSFPQTVDEGECPIPSQSFHSHD